MNNQNDRSFFHKLYIIIVLSSVIVAGLVYLIASGGTERIQKNAHSTRTPEVVDHTAKLTEAPSPSASPSATPSPSPSAQAVDITSDDSIDRIVNRSHPVDPSYVPADLVIPDVPMNNTQTIRKEAADAMKEMFDAADQDGIHLYLISGYRSYETQVSLYHTYLARFGNDYTEHLDCHPGASEHQLGLAADFGTVDQACELSTCFSDTDASQWLMNNAWKYGWILRYPQGKEAVTGIMYSPWNYRYAGKEEAGKIHDSGLTMEEYYGLTG